MNCSKNCECCLMPFAEDPLGENRENPKYCSYCFHNGKLNAEDAKNLGEFQEKCFEGMLANGLPRWKAHFFAWTIRFAPYWKQRKKGAMGI